MRTKLALAIVLIVMAVLSVGIAYDYRSERRLHFDEQRRKLSDRASNLAVAFHLIDDRKEFARFVLESTRQSKDPSELNRYVLVLGPSGNIIAEASALPNREMRRLLLSEEWRESRIPGHDIAQARVSSEGYTFIAAEYMDLVQGQLREELLRRLATSLIVSAGIVLTVYLVLSFSVLGPLARIRQVAAWWAQREFGRHVPEDAGAREIRALSADLNRMADLLEAYEQRQGVEMQQARQIQANLMPKSMPPISALALTTAYRPAEIVAGDLFDVFALDSERLAVAIMDVSGHGISAAMLTGIVQMALHHHLSRAASAVEATEAVNADLLRCVASGQFVTLCVGIWNRADRTWTYVSAGHPGGILLRADGAQVLEATGPLLGVLDEAAWQSNALNLQSGDRLFLYTDGVTEAGKPANGMEDEGLRQLLLSTRDRTVPQQVEQVMAEVARLHGPHPPDDSTLLALEVLPAQP